VSKFLNKYVRKFHRWLGILFVVMVVVVLLAHNTAYGFAAQRLQQMLVLVMALTGLYLFALPWWVKWRRRQRAQ